MVLDIVDADDEASVEWVFSLMPPLGVVLDIVDADDEAGVDLVFSLIPPLGVVLDISTELPCAVVVVILTDVLSIGILVWEVENWFNVEEAGDFVVDIISHPKS